jgi:serine/threonine protein kinase/WD40 repeat protein
VIGSQLAHYRITGELGSGGMGEVWRAEDTRLDREVAIKVLPDDFATDEDRRARFEREAKTLASLNHPNIATVFGFEEIEGKVILVMELLEGESLRERVAEGPLPYRKAAEIGAAIARGLGAAHDRGIVHRDIKPENVFLTGDGQVKVLDFGLATDHELSGIDGGATNTPTVTQRTGPGAVLGTVGYMAPEQVRGEQTDPRTDIFALGAVLYEMATGRRAFDRDTAPETMTAILREEPPEPADLEATVPAALERVFHRCLEKRPEERYQSARDLAFHLEALGRAEGSASSVSERPISTRAGRRVSSAPAVVLALGAAALGALSAVWFTTFEGTGELSISRMTHRRGMVWSARFTPETGSVVYGATWENSPLELFMTRIDSVDSREMSLGAADVLAVSQGGEMALSLDRRFTSGWETSGTLATSSLVGSAPRPLLEGVSEADWGPDGRSMAVVREVSGRYRLEYPIGTTLHETDGWLSDIRIRPGGDLIAFVDHPLRGDNLGSVAVVDLEGTVTVLQPGGSQGLAWSPSGDEIWSSSGRRVVALSLNGDSRTVYVGTDPMWLEDISPDGRVLISNAGIRREMAGRASGDDVERNLSWFDWSSPQALSADGATLLFDEQNIAGNNGYLVFIRSIDGSPPVRIGIGTGRALSPDGSWALSVSDPFGEARWELLPTGIGEVRPLPEGRIHSKLWAHWLDDGERLIVAGSEPGKPLGLYLRGLDSAEETLLTPDGIDYVRSGHAVSPDGKWVTATPIDGSPRLYSLEGGDSIAIPGLEEGEVPVQWTGDGKEIFAYRPGELPARVWRVDIESGDRSFWGELAPSDPAGVFGIDYLAISPDGAGYVYSYRRLLSTLYVFEGLQ